MLLPACLSRSGRPGILRDEKHHVEILKGTYRYMERKTIGQELQARTRTKKQAKKEANRFFKKTKRQKSAQGDLESKKDRKKWKKWLKIAIFVIFAAIALTIIFMLIIDYQVEKIGKAHVLTIDALTKDYDCVIVPGAAVYNNAVPSPMLADRLDVAADIYQKGLVPKILVSGDNGTVEYNEVLVMKNYLLGLGIPEEDIVMDYAGFDTYQTLYRARDIFLVKKAVIVTQDFHLYRALYIGEMLSLELDGVDSALRDYHNSTWNRSREYLARVKAFLECVILKPEPKFLGDTIPINNK
jgi:vancomycin permeability regulator SanA